MAGRQRQLVFLTLAAPRRTSGRQRVSTFDPRSVGGN
jgi:hypothetical protein